MTSFLLKFEKSRNPGCWILDGGMVKLFWRDMPLNYEGRGCRKQLTPGLGRCKKARSE